MKQPSSGEIMPFCRKIRFGCCVLLAVGALEGRGVSADSGLPETLTEGEGRFPVTAIDPGGAFVARKGARSNGPLCGEGSGEAFDLAGSPIWSPVAAGSAGTVDEVGSSGAGDSGERRLTRLCRLQL
jgi:hypothetical protein